MTILLMVIFFYKNKRTQKGLIPKIEVSALIYFVCKSFIGQQ